MDEVGSRLFLCTFVETSGNQSKQSEREEEFEFECNILT